MTDAEDAVEEFLRDADKVYNEYDKGYMDADAALSRLDNQIETLREQLK
jgi:peptidoglycan hydrolase CwlO-like protein